MVINDDQRLPIKVNIYVMDISQAADGSVDLVEPGSTSWSAAKWITLKTPRRSLAPGQRAAIVYEINVPPDAKGGGYAAIVCESAAPRPRSGGGAVIFKVRIPHVLFINIKGTEEYLAKLLAIRPSATKVGIPLKWYVALQNQGNVLVRPVISLTLKRGEHSRTLNINPGKRAVLPGQKRRFYVEDPSGVKQEGIYEVKVTVDYGGGKALLGEGKVTFK